MVSVPQVADALQQVLTTVPTALARETGFCQRQSKLTAAVFVPTTVLGWLAQPDATLTQLTQRAADRQVSISPQGLAQRFTPAAATLLKQVWDTAVAQVIGSDPVAVALLERCAAVVVIDSTTVGLPDGLADVWAGCGGRVTQGSQSALNLTVSLDLRTGRLATVPSDGRVPDKSSPLQHAPLPAGALRIADLGFWSLDVLQEIADQEAYFLSRLHLQTVVFDADGERLDLLTWLPRQHRRRLSLAVTLGVAARVPARLLIVRVPTRVATARQARSRAEAKREGTKPSAAKLALAAWTLLVTNAPPDVLAIREAVVVARARWQIELLVTLGKDGGHLDEWRTKDPQRILCEVYAKLAALVIQHGILLITCWLDADRSLTKVARSVRDHAVALLLVLDHRRAVAGILRAIARGVPSSGRITHRRRKPNLFQLLTDPALGGVA